MTRHIEVLRTMKLYCATLGCRGLPGLDCRCTFFINCAHTMMAMAVMTLHPTLSPHLASPTPALRCHGIAIGLLCAFVAVL